MLKNYGQLNLINHSLTSFFLRNLVFLLENLIELNQKSLNEFIEL